MKIRHKLLLERLLCEDNVSPQQLAEEFSLSVKTIRGDLGVLDSYLHQALGIRCLQLDANQARFTHKEELATQARACLRLDDFYLYKLSAGERVLLILSQLLASAGYLTIGDLGQQLCVSRGTINLDLQAVRQWCDRNRVQVQFKKSRGIMVDEGERRRRELCAQLVQEYKSLSGIQDLSPEGGLYGKLFSGVNLSAIREVILEAEDRFGFILSDVAYEGLVVHIALSIKRDREQSQSPAIPGIRRDSVQHQMAEFIAAQLNEELGSGLEQGSVDYITMHIFGQSKDGPPELHGQTPYLQTLAERLILAVSRRLAFNFHSDDKLYQALVTHLCAAMDRMKHHLLLKNPIKDTVLREYRDIYRAVEAESALLTSYAGGGVTDDELAYIVIHFASAMERERQLTLGSRIPSVILVCGTGEGTARLVQEQLTRHFQLEVALVVPAHRLGAAQGSVAVDFIISTVPLENPLPVVLVGPIIRDADVAAINRTLGELGFTPLLSVQEPTGRLAGQVQALVRRYGTPGTEAQLLEGLAELLGQHPQEGDHEKQKRRSYMLSELLKDAYIVLNQEAEDWQEAVRLGGHQLLQYGVVEPGYIEAAIQNVKDLGPYIVLTKGVAVPHASAEYGVHRTAISLVTLREPVCFGNPDNDPVRYVFTLATTDNGSHLMALRDLVGLLDNPEFFATIDAATGPEAVTQYIKAFEEATYQRKESKA